MRVFSREIPYHNGDVFTLVCTSDWHFGAAACGEGKLEAMLKDHGRKPNTFFISAGDQQNDIAVKDKRFAISELHPRYRNEDNYIDYMVHDLSCLITQHTEPEQWLVLGLGNHELELVKHTSMNPHLHLCQKTGIQDGGWSFFYLLKFSHVSGGGGRTVVIYGVHGYGGGGRTEGGDLTKYARQTQYYEFDIGLFGHTHTKWGKRLIRIEPTRRGSLKVVERPQAVANCGTFLKTLSGEVIPTYSEKACYPPRDIGYITMFLRPDTANPYVDIRVME
jgi:hypothetical protein